MKYIHPFFSKWMGISILCLCLSTQASAQLDTLCNASDTIEIFGETNYNYGATTNAFSSFNRTDIVVGQPLISESISQSQDFQTGFGIYAPFQLPPQPPQLQASQGDFNNRIDLNWAVNPLSPEANGFVIYRDGSYLTAVGPDVRSFVDFNIQAGELYDYSIAGTNSYGEGSTNHSIGFVNPNGVITGEVTTNNGNPVPGVNVKITPQTGSSLYFDGVDDYLCINYDEAYLSTEFTASVYVKMPNANSDKAIIDWGSSLNQNWWISAISNGTDKGFEVHVADGSVASSLSYFLEDDINDWHQLSVTYNGVAMSLFVDGVFVATQDVTLSSLPNYMNVGSFIDGSGAFDGYIDDIRIYDRALSQSEILETIDRTISATEDGVVAYWKMDEGYGEKVFDNSNTDNDARIVGATFDNDIPDVYNTGVTDVTGYYGINGINYSSVQSFTVTPIADFYFNQGLEFSAAEESCANLTAYAIPEESTIELTFYPFDLNAKQSILHKEGDVELWLEQGTLYLDINGTTTNLGLIEAQYYRLALTLDNITGSANVLLDGNFIANNISFSTISNWTDTPWRLGADLCTNGTQYYTGIIDEFVVFEGLLDQQYLQQSFVIGTPDAGYVDTIYNVSDTVYVNYPIFSYFDLNEGAGTEISDYAAVNDPSIGGVRIGTVQNIFWSTNVRISNTTPHEFEPNQRVVNINTSNTAIGNVNFNDVSTINITGTVRFNNTFCFAEGINILVNGDDHFPPIVTDENGRWSAEFEPGETVQLTPVFEDHLFTPGFHEFRNLQSPKAGIVFLDNTTRTLGGQIAGGLCRKSIIPSGAIVKVAAESLNGCYYREIQLDNPDGNYLFEDMPPIPFAVSVIEHSNSVIYSFFQNLGGQESDLRNIEADTINFTYFSPPELEATPIGELMCDGQTYNVMPYALNSTEIQVYESYDGGRCYLESAELEIFNEVAGIDSIVQMDSLVYVHNFRPGSTVNVFAPYTRKIEITANVNGRSGILDPPLEVILLGQKSNGGQSFTSTGRPEVNDILRDPPGDNSFAWRESGTTTCKTTSISTSEVETSGGGSFVSLGPKFDLSVGIFGTSIGKEFEVIATSDLSSSQTTSYGDEVSTEVCMTNSTVITTSDDPAFVGRDGDVFIGTTSNLRWGVATLLSWDADSCKVDAETMITVEKKGFNSSFIYSRSFIENTLLPDLLSLAAAQPDSAHVFLNTREQWLSILEEEDVRQNIAIKDATKIITLDAGTTYEELIEESITSESSKTRDLEYDFSLDITAGAFWAGIGTTASFSYSTNESYGIAQTLSEDDSEAYGYFISDDDPGDFHAVIVNHPKQIDANNTVLETADDLNELVSNNLPNPFSNPTVLNSTENKLIVANSFPDTYIQDLKEFAAPIFNLVAGETRCPFEFGSISKENLTFTSDRTVQINVPSNSAASFALNLGNDSPDFNLYTIGLIPGTNANGAIVKLGGQPLIAGVGAQYAPNSYITEYITVERPSGGAYDHSFTLEFYSDCEKEISEDTGYDLALDTLEDGSLRNINGRFIQTIDFNVSFIDPCSPVAISFPTQGFVVTPADNNVLNITINDYIKDDPKLDDDVAIRIQYRQQNGNGSWINIAELARADLGETFTIVQWNTELLEDGPYEIRAVTNCVGVSPDLQGQSTFIKGNLERLPPEIIGVPEPADGIWDPGDEISITFNEDIDCANVFLADILGNNTIGLYDATTDLLVDATISCVGNKITIVPNINPADFENRTFRVMVSGQEYDDAQTAINPAHIPVGVTDLAGNPVVDNIVWEFFVNQNNIEWVGTDIIEFTEVFQPLTITRQVRNRGGTIVSWTIEDIPSWVTITPNSGTMNAGQIADVTFEFQDDLLIGDYDATVQLSGSRGDEPLGIDYRVRCPQPDWFVENPGQYSGSMNMVTTLDIFGIESADPSDMIVAIIDGEIRGVGNIEYFPALDTDVLGNGWLAFITIFGDSDDNAKPISFNVWDGDACVEYAQVLETFDYTNGDFIGSPVDPETLHVLNLVQKCTPLYEGWNWVSVNLDLFDNSIENVMSSLTHLDSLTVKYQNEYARYYEFNNYGWQHQLDTIYPENRYMVNIRHDDLWCITGEPYKPLDHPIEVDTGWNWIGYIPQVGTSVSQALASLNPLNGDIIKDQTRFAQYVAGIGWIGNLNFMESPTGYLLKIANPGVINYPDPGNATDEAPLVKGLDKLRNIQLNTEQRRYNHNMNIIAKVEGINLEPGDELRMYVDGKLKGKTFSLEVPSFNSHLFFMTIFHDDPEMVKFKLFKQSSQREYRLNGSTQFEADALRGRVEDPLVLSLNNESNTEILQLNGETIFLPDSLYADVTLSDLLPNGETCNTFVASSALLNGTQTIGPGCAEPTGYPSNMIGYTSITYGTRSNFVQMDDELIFINPATNETVGCGTPDMLGSEIFFDFVIQGQNTSVPIPIDVHYYSAFMDTTLVLKQGVMFENDAQLGDIINPHEFNFSPIELAIDSNDNLIITLLDSTWTGSYCIELFGQGCSGDDWSAILCIRRIDLADCLDLAIRTGIEDEIVVRAVEIQSDATIDDLNETRYYIGGETVILQPGFNVTPGTNFEVQIVTCPDE